MVYYTTTTDVESYLAAQPGGVPSSWPADPTQQDTLVSQAELDVDRLAATVSMDPSTGRRLTAVLDQMAPYQVQALKNAVAAQVEYKLFMGGAFFRDPQFDEVRGPAFTTKGRRPTVGPKARREFTAGAFALGLGRSASRTTP